MLLDIINEEIKGAVDAYKRICEDPANISSVDQKYIDEIRKAEFITNFIRASKKSRQRKAELEHQNYEKIKEDFAYYIGSKLFKKLNLSFNVPKEVQTLVGKLFIDNQ